jgi:hypothetical protein
MERSLWRVCRLKLLLALASAVILGSQSRGTRDHILLSQILRLSFFRLLRLAGLRWRYSTQPLHVIYSSTRESSQSQSHISTDGQSISKSWCRPPSGAHEQIFITLWQLWSCFSGAPTLTRERVYLLYMLLALASVVPWDSWLYFTVSDLRLPFSSPPTTRRVTDHVENLFYYFRVVLPRNCLATSLGPCWYSNGVSIVVTLLRGHVFTGRCIETAVLLLLRKCV